MAIRSLGPVPATFDGAAFATRYGLDVTDFIVEGVLLYTNSPRVPASPVLDVTPAPTADSRLDGVEVSRRTSAALVVAVAALSNGLTVPAWAKLVLAGPAADIQLARANQRQEVK